jgi:multidrug transporter EmrE-like cation transporter
VVVVVALAAVFCAFACVMKCQSHIPSTSHAALTAVGTALAALFADETTAEHCQAIRHVVLVCATSSLVLSMALTKMPDSHDPSSASAAWEEVPAGSPSASH